MNANSNNRGNFAPVIVTHSLQILMHCKHELTSTREYDVSVCVYCDMSCSLWPVWIRYYNNLSRSKVVMKRKIISTSGLTFITKLASTWIKWENHSCHDLDYMIGNQIFLETMVSSTNQKVGMRMILGISQQFTQMGQSEFNAEQNHNVWTLGESHCFSAIKLKSYKCCFSSVISLSYNFLWLNTLTDCLVHHTHHINWHGYFFYLIKVFYYSHPNLPCIGMSDIGQESVIFSKPVY